MLGAVGGRRLCVLTMVDALNAGGAEILAGQVARGLDPARFESLLCSTRPSPPGQAAALHEAGVEVLELGRRSRGDLRSWLPLVRLLRGGRVHVLHAHKFGSNLWAALLTRIAPVPVLVAHEHSWSFAGRAAPLRRLADRELIARAAAAFVAVSERDRERMVSLERIPAEKVVLVRNCVPDRPPGDGARARRELGIPPEAPVVGTVCGLRPEKAVELALAAAARAAERHPELRFLAVGDGPERARLEREAERLRLRAVFAGRRPSDEVPELVAAMDVVVLTSRFEGMPLAVLEWMAAGRAIAAFRVGGVPTILADGVEGVLVPPRAAAALGDVVARLLADPEERLRLGAAARRRQQAEFRLAHTVGALEDLYERLWAAAAR